MYGLLGERGNRRSGPGTCPEHLTLQDAPPSITTRPHAATLFGPPDPHTDMSASHVVYVLSCADDSLYTGYTTDLERRVAEHNAGEGAKYTRGRTPVAVVHSESHESRSAALSREYEIKQLSRARKLELVGGE